MGFPLCDNSTCFLSNFSTCVDDKCYESHVICTSYCDDKKLCNGVFQCADNRLIFFSQFCDGIIDCIDRSDEITNQPGFKCHKCILPQNNLHDQFAHYVNGLDFCFTNNTYFQCLDQQLLISSEQVCDGVIDCCDLSDECLCETYFENEICTNLFEDKLFQCFDNEHFEPWYKVVSNKDNSIFYECQTKYNSSFLSIACDGIPECIDFSDECQCVNPPDFCNDTCHSYFNMGDRYCDGIEDPAWQYINKSECPQGFDEMLCPKRFKCNASGKVSIEELQVCDGTVDCDDESDEKDCAVSLPIFSSDTEMIANPAIKSAFWIIGFLVIMGNSYVFATTIVLLKKKQTFDGIKFQHVIILNISIADFIMGIYLLIVAVYDAKFSNIYGGVDREWRSSLTCSIIGSLAVISSEASCFLLVLLTAFRLKNITKVVESLNSSLHQWKIFICLAWIFSLMLSIFPLTNVTSQYFMHSFAYSNDFQSGKLGIAKLQQFACRIAALSNTTIMSNGNKLQSIRAFFENDPTKNLSINLFGYYGGTSVCMPRFYVVYGEQSWEYTFAILTINFLSFLFIAVSYFIMYKHSTKSSANFRNNKPNNQATRLQKRIARIIATDFCCWIPICITTYVRLGLEFSDIAYQISAVLLLPINSAINPFLFSSLPDKLAEICQQNYLKLKKMCNF